MKYFFLAFCLLLGNFAQAQIDRKGNGGDVVVCKNKAQLLDVYEASSLRGFKLDLGGKNLTIEQKIDKAVQRLLSLDPMRAAAVAHNAKLFFKHAKFVRGIELTDIDDSDEVYLPRGCEKKQIAVQRKQVVPGDPFYVVDLDLWDKMDRDNQAALVLHEVIFASSYGAWKSSEVRFLNSASFSSFFDNKSQKYYYDYITNSVLAETTLAGRGTDGRWYYQLLYNDDKPFLEKFGTLGHVNRDEKDEWQRRCSVTRGQPILVSDIPQIWQIMNNFNWTTSFRGDTLILWGIDEFGGQEA